MPSVLTLLACYGGLQQFDLSDLRMVIFAGEVFPPKHLARLIAELPHPRYLNWYGPTETNVCTAFEVPAGWADAQPPPIGKACANTEVFAVTSEGRRVSPARRGGRAVRAGSLADARVLGTAGARPARRWSGTRSGQSTTSSCTGPVTW